MKQSHILLIGAAIVGWILYRHYKTGGTNTDLLGFASAAKAPVITTP